MLLIHDHAMSSVITDIDGKPCMVCEGMILLPDHPLIWIWFLVQVGAEAHSDAVVLPSVTPLQYS